jgi:hypothetical protein
MIPEILQKGGEGGTNEKKAKRQQSGPRLNQSHKIYFGEKFTETSRDRSSAG